MRVRVTHIRFDQLARGTVLSILLVSVVTAQTGPAGHREGTFKGNDPALTPAELWQSLASSALPRLWLPKREVIFEVDSRPVLGSGKIDMRGATAKAVELARAKNSRQ